MTAFRFTGAPLSLWLGAILVLSAPSSARADSAEVIFPVSAGGAPSIASPQRFALELRVGPYMPQIDSQPGLTGTPFATMYGNTIPENTGGKATHQGPGILNWASPTARVYVGGEFDWQALRIPHLGTLGPGFGIGFTQMSAPAYQTEALPDTFLDSSDTATLTIIPMYLVAVLRADVLPREIGIPLVPYAKAGLGGAFWRSSKNGSTSSVNGQKGMGYSLGFHAALGLSFDLGVLDRVAEHDLDVRTGINHIYFYGEFMLSALNESFQGHALRVGTTTGVVGVAFEF